jgi:hypothetical protein
VELHRSDDGAPAALDLEIDLVRHKTLRADGGSRSVLGRTAIDQDGSVRGPIFVLIDSVESLIEEGAIHGNNAVLPEQALGRALGRVLAHEIGHVLLGTSHDADGLMRRSFLPEDLTRRDRSRFQLAAPALVRLRARVVRFAADADAQRD